MRRFLRGRARDAKPLSALILRSRAKRGVSKDGAAPWFETRLSALLTMRPIEAAE
jgi:hypothetical protein